MDFCPLWSPLVQYDVVLTNYIFNNLFPNKRHILKYCRSLFL